VYTPSFTHLTEGDPVDNPVAYALSKRMAEQAVALFSDRMSLCIGRIFGVFGPGQNQMLPALIRERLRAGEGIQLAPHPEKGQDGGLHVSFIYNPDLGRILVRLAEKALAGGEVPPVFNLGGPESVSLEYLAREMGKAAGIAPRLEHTRTPRAFDLTADISLLLRTVDARFTPFPEAVQATVA
jgi:nucleoside-diphosphate-sugar epimerase